MDVNDLTKRFHLIVSRNIDLGIITFLYICVFVSLVNAKIFNVDQLYSDLINEWKVSSADVKTKLQIIICSCVFLTTECPFPTGGGTATCEGQKAQDGASVLRSAGAGGGGGWAGGDPGQLEPGGPTCPARHQQCQQGAAVERLRWQEPGLHRWVTQTDEHVE